MHVISALSLKKFYDSKDVNCQVGRGGEVGRGRGLKWNFSHCGSIKTSYIIQYRGMLS